MTVIEWERYPLVAGLAQARTWLDIQVNLGLAPNTIQTYGHGLEDYLRFCERYNIFPPSATREHIAAYIGDLRTRPTVGRSHRMPPEPGRGLSNATIQQRLTVVRLYYDYLVEERIRERNPVGRGRYTAGKAFGNGHDRGLVPQYRKLAWIPNDQEWRCIVDAMRHESLRNRVMFAMAYDAALRREELCALQTGDIDPSQRLLRIRAETTKNRQERIIPYSQATGTLYQQYLQLRREMSRQRGPLFLSESRRNHAQPVTIWTWSKVIRGIAVQSGVHQFTTHTLRHLCLTDLAHADWDIHEIALFAGHRSTQSTLLYIHLSGRDLSAKLAEGMTHLHAARVALLAEVLA